ncbi:MAG: hypothetical protein CMK06_05500 [Ponticaulis sp.]|nr:hypothetical protein [Ponticaulis sp.]|tara:strand:+ start:33469 stop:33864 length:396 start_codon:yes stop_codon:yes gene_type:complete
MNILRQLLIGVWSALCLALAGSAVFLAEMGFRRIGSSVLSAPFEFTGQAWFLAIAAVCALTAFFWSRALWGVAAGVIAAFVHAMIFSHLPQIEVFMRFLPVLLVPPISIALAEWQAKSDQYKKSSPEEVFA